MQTRSSVLGKRPHQLDSPASATCDDSRAANQLPLTPEVTPKPKRARVSLSIVDGGDSNKENVPPLSPEFVVTRSLVRRHASTSNIPATPTTPASAISQLAISTPPPTPHVSLLPIHARARALLRATCNNTLQIAGRDEERAVIECFIRSFLEADSSEENIASSLYISGTPGTGKTALVNSVISSFDENQKTDKIVPINCMALNSIDALWDRLAEELHCTPKTKSPSKSRKLKGRQAVEKSLAGMKHRCILILDELDHIATTSENLTSVFSLPQAHHSTLRIIGIANTHTLTSSLSQCPGAGVKTLHFSAYSPAQLLQILQARLSPLCESGYGSVNPDQLKKFLPPPTLMLLTKKIATQTGDVRALFEVLRGAIDVAVSGSAKTIIDADANPLVTPIPTVSPNHILDALKAYAPSAPKQAAANLRSAPATTSNSEVVAKVLNLGLQHRLVLLTVLLASKRQEASLPLSALKLSSPTKSPMKRTVNGSGCLDAAQLHSYYSSVLTRGDTDLFAPVSRSEFSDLIGMLETVGLVVTSSAYTPSGLSSPSKSGQRGFGRTASFGGPSKSSTAHQGVKLAASVRVDEALRGLGITSTEGVDVGPVGVREEEIKVIWVKESARSNREIKAKVRSQDDAENPFHDAVED